MQKEAVHVSLKEVLNEWKLEDAEEFQKTDHTKGSDHRPERCPDKCEVEKG